MKILSRAILSAIAVASAVGLQVPRHIGHSDSRMRTSAQLRPLHPVEAVVGGAPSSGSTRLFSQYAPFLEELVGEKYAPEVEQPLKDDHVYVTMYEIGGPVTNILSFTVNKKLALIPHVGVRVYGKEWFYSNRIEHEPVDVMENMLASMPRFTLDLGPTTKTPEEIEEWVESVNDDWVPDSYDVFFKNCNHFGVLMAETITEDGMPEPYRQACLDITEKMLDNLPNWRKEMGLHFMTKITRLVVSAWGRATKDEKKSTAKKLQDKSTPKEAVVTTGGSGSSPRKRTSSTELSASAIDEDLGVVLDAPSSFGVNSTMDHALESHELSSQAMAHHTTVVVEKFPALEEETHAKAPAPKNEQLTIRKLKQVEDEARSPFAEALMAIDPTGTVRRRLWTKADFMHIHAISGTYFLAVGCAWLLYSHVMGFQHPEQAMGTTGPFLASLLLAGLANALSAIPMSRFSSDKMFDFEDLKANGFTVGGTGLTCMSLWVAWWFSGSYPDVLRPLDSAFFVLWTAICVGSTANWEYMLQQNFESSSGKARRSKFGKESKEVMDQKTILYRIASWPNLTQLMFISSIPLGGLTWVSSMTDKWPMQMTPMYHYGLASAIGYALSMLAETLRDRKLLDLQTDMLLLVFGFVLPMVSVVVDAVTYGDAVTINPLDYWVMFAGTTPGL